jgi:arylsulfatase A-like enzyme
MLNNKIFVSILLMSVIFSCKSKNEKTQEVENGRPNIIFILTDDHASHAISAYGGIYDELAPTPNIDRVANEGMIFNNVFCTNAICGPSRASILTGKYSHVNGYYKNEGGGSFNPDQWTFPQALQQAGYTTSLFGKWHLGSEPVGFDFFKYHDNPGQQGFYWNPVYNENGQKITESGYATNLTTDFALKWLEENQKGDKPFCMLLQYKAPHRNWYPDSIYIDIWDDIEMPYPDTFNDDYTGKAQTAGDTDMTMDDLNRKDMKLTPPDSLSGRELHEWNNFGNKRGEVVWMEGAETPQENREMKYQRYIKDYLACVKSVDDNIGRVLKYLDEKGLVDNTVIVYTSDQGFYLGDHGFFDKRFIYEESLRMPFIVRYPEKVKPKSINNDIITNIDFAPTLLELAGVKPPKEVQGRSFVDNMKGSTPSDWPDEMYYHYYEFPFWHHVQPHYGIRTERYKLAHFYYNIDVWEFYDLKTDPEELVNQIDNPEYAKVIKEMKIRLNKLQEKYGDDKSLKEFRMITDKEFK